MPTATADPALCHVLVLQGGGALGAYQAGVYEALGEAGVMPDWVAGISIGAINAAIIAGNAPEVRTQRLRQFWETVTSGPALAPLPLGETARAWINDANATWGAALGAPGFFRPRFPPPQAFRPGAPEALSFYDTAPLKQTLEQLVDFDRINARQTRLSVGAVNIRTGNFAYFDNTHQTIRPEHIMASGALPPGLPPIEIDGEHYWDGGLVSNTPLQYVLDEECVRDLLIVQLDLFNARGPMPCTLLEASEREKDIRYSSRTRLNTDAGLGIHRLKSALRELIGTLPAAMADDPNVKLLSDLSKENTVTVVQLIYRDRAYEGASKDFEFSRASMLEHWASGMADARRSLRQRQRYLQKPPKGGTAVFDPGRDDRISPSPQKEPLP